MNRSTLVLLTALGSVTLLAGCVGDPSLAVFDTENQMKLRSHQTRVFDTTDREKMLRTVIATLQDFGFVIDKADAVLGSVSGTKLDEYEMRMTVTVRPQGETRLLVRASAEFKPKGNAAARSVEDAAPYRDFFAALEKSIFLAAHQVD